MCLWRVKKAQKSHYRQWILMKFQKLFPVSYLTNYVDHYNRLFSGELSHVALMMKHSLANHLQVYVLINCVYFCWKSVYKKFPLIKVIPRLLFKHSDFWFQVEEFGGCSVCGAYLERKRRRKRKWERGSNEMVKVKPVTMRRQFYIQIIC